MRVGAAVLALAAAGCAGSGGTAAERYYQTKAAVVLPVRGDGSTLLAPESGTERLARAYRPTALAGGASVVAGVSGD